MTVPPLPPSEEARPWTCQVCQRVFVVPSLARLCEEKHQKGLAADTKMGTTP